MNSPYTTKSGLQIGIRHRENGIRMPIDDPDMIRLQEALIITSENLKRQKKHRLGYLVYFTLVIFTFLYTFVFQ